jgi:hypothetical protein
MLLVSLNVGCLVFRKIFVILEQFGTWNVRSLYRVGSLKTVSRELARYKLDLVGVQEVRLEGCDTKPAGEYTTHFSMEREMRIMN